MAGSSPEKDEKLVAAVAVELVFVCPAGAPQGLRRGEQVEVHLMPQGVVHLLQVVEICRSRDKGACPPLAAPPGRFGHLPVQASGERIGGGDAAQRLAQLLLFIAHEHLMVEGPGSGGG